VAKTTQPKLFKPVVILTKEVLDMRERFLAAVLLHESVHSTTGLFDPDETLPTQIESDFLRSVGVDASIEALKKENPGIWDQYYIDTAEESFRVSGCGGLRSSPVRCKRRPQSPRVRIVLFNTLELLL